MLMYLNQRVYVESGTGDGESDGLRFPGSPRGGESARRRRRSVWRWTFHLRTCSLLNGRFDSVFQGLRSDWASLSVSGHE